MHNNGVYGNDGFTLDELTKMTEVEIRYVDGTGKEIAESRKLKAYAVTEVKSLDKAPIAIDGYAFDKYKNDQYVLESGFVRELFGEPIVLEYKKVDTGNDPGTESPANSGGKTNTGGTSENAAAAKGGVNTGDVSAIYLYAALFATAAAAYIYMKRKRA